MYSYSIQDMQTWRTPEEIVEIAFQRSSVVMMNEAHAGEKRCIRTRQIGQRILPTAHQAGCRHLAMEALYPLFSEECNSSRRVASHAGSYLSQPEMRAFIQAALDLGWTLIPYEADSFKWLSERHGIDLSNSDEHERFRQHQKYQAEFLSMEFTNWREEQQARNLITALQSLPVNISLLVWCGNSHHAKIVIQDWIPMGYQFQQHSGINPFVVDQTRTVHFDSSKTQVEMELAVQFADQLIKHGGTAGFLTEEAPSILGHDFIIDAYLLSIHNELE